MVRLCQVLILVLISVGWHCAIAQSSISVYFSSELLPENSIWFTNPPDSSALRYRLSRQPALFWQEEKPHHGQIITIDENNIKQSILGIGASLEATTVYALHKNKTDDEIKDVLRALIDPEKGVGFNLFRLTIGTSDFSDGRSLSDHPQGFYSYQDQPGKPFSIENDIELGIIDVILAAQEVAASLEPPQRLLFFASCWSPPAWMKTSGQLVGGTLKPGYTDSLAVYYRRFVQAYHKQGIEIHAITLQNEPRFSPRTYPGMVLTWDQELELALAVYRQWEHLQARDITPPDIWIHDHNFNGWVDADSILSSLERMGKKEIVKGIAFHNYESYPIDSLLVLQSRYPDVKLLFSEKSEFGVKGMANIVDYFRHGFSSYNAWVTMSTQTLDEHNQGPYNTLDMLSPTMLIQKDGNKAGWYVTPEYYLLGQFSKFIRSGSHRIACDPGDPLTVTALAIKRADNKQVLILVNQTNKEQPVRVNQNDRWFEDKIPPKSVATFIWAL
jgi:glucosylceramidase